MKRAQRLFVLMGTIVMVATASQRLEDPEFLRRLKESLHQYEVSYPEEKVYVQFDKPFYRPPDDIWFNAFVLNSSTNEPTAISDVVYVELIDPKGNVAARQELVVKEGTAHGDFGLSDDSAGGMYSVRAFTQWMKNFGDSVFFTKDIQVQRIITPRLLLKLDYLKESYGPGDVVKAKITVTNLKNEKVASAHVIASVKIDGVMTSELAVYTGADGVANISFKLPEVLQTTDGLLHAIITTDVATESISRAVPIVLNKITIGFFPEGGQWIENVPARIAFKALNEFNKGADISGTVVDQSGNEITHFESFHMGMGAFDIHPLPGKQYFARIDTPSGNGKVVPLPAPMREGFTLQCTTVAATDSLVWNIHAPSASSGYLVGRAGGELAFGEKLSLNAGNNIVRVGTQKFPMGVAVFTLFDANGTERCERLVFVNNSKGMNIAITPDKASYLPREKVSVNVKTTDQGGKPIRAKLSLSVVDDQLLSFADDKQDNILSSVFLSSELAGEVQEPSYYFDQQEPDAPIALDYLLLTQGWRRFSWKEVASRDRIIVHRREKVNVVGGRLINDKGEGISTEVTLIEMGNAKRIETVRATQDGFFTFKNIDPTIPILLMAKKPSTITIQKEKTFSISLNDKEGTVIQPLIASPKFGNNIALAQTQDIIPEAGDADVSMAQDAKSLSEVVVVGYGAVMKRDLVGSVTTISDYSLDHFGSSASVENAMQGRVAGVQIQQQSVSPGAAQRIVIRGTSSLGAGRNEPLYIVDGHPIGHSINQNFSNGSVFGPEDIVSIEVMASPEASALFGSAAANGAILINTRSRIGYTPFQSRPKAPKYSSLTIEPRKFSATREFYTPPVSKDKNAKREDFRTTAYWNHTIVTGDNGEATVTFNNTDAVSAFRITAEGISGSGLVGRAEKVFSTLLPLSLDAKLPEFLGFEDVLKLPVMVKNETAETMTGSVTIDIPKMLALHGAAQTSVRLAPHTAQTLWFTITPKAITGDFPIVITLQSPTYRDEIRHTLHVQPAGFPVRLSFAAQEREKIVRFPLHDAEAGTLKATVTVFPDVLSDLLSGAESIFREPHGCFEQTSSSTFPNVLALQFLKQTNSSNLNVQEKALAYIRAGYKRLISYEVAGGGFDWFGSPPAHEALTAYGLIEFYEMKKVYPDVDQKMIERTRKWLLSRRNGDGTFKLHQAGFDDFSRPSGNISNAYITYALSETGTSDIEKEYQYNLSEALKTKDMYQLALMANIASNLKKEKDYALLLQYFQKHAGPGLLSSMVASHSIVWSQGTSLTNETTALWALAIMKSKAPDIQLISSCIKHIVASRSFGMFGSTQATILCLKALTEYARLVRSTQESGNVEVYVNGKAGDSGMVDKNTQDALVLDKWQSKLIPNAENTLRVLFSGNPLSYAVDVQWYTKKPQSSDRCQVSLTTTLDKHQMQVNETVRMTASLKNKSTNGIPMTMAVLGIPAGLSVQPWQLKEMQEKKLFDFYEISGGKLAIYYRQMKPSEQRTLKFDLKAEMPGKFTASASAAYLYYTNEYKDWVKGETVEIIDLVHQ